VIVQVVSRSTPFFASPFIISPSRKTERIQFSLTIPMLTVAPAAHRLLAELIS